MTGYGRSDVAWRCALAHRGVVRTRRLCRICTATDHDDSRRHRADHREQAGRIDDAFGENIAAGAQPRLASEPAQLADDLVADEQALRDPSTPEARLVAAAHRQQAAYRAIGRHPEWDAITRPRIPPSLLGTYDGNVDARRQLTAMTPLRTRCPRGASRRRLPPTSCSAITARRSPRPASTGTTWRRST